MSSKRLDSEGECGYEMEDLGDLEDSGKVLDEVDGEGDEPLLSGRDTEPGECVGGSSKKRGCVAEGLHRVLSVSFVGLVSCCSWFMCSDYIPGLGASGGDIPV